MGIAAYNRGSACISRGVLMDAGTWREPAKPTPRPATWGDKAKARALDRARRVLSGNRRLGRDVEPDVLAAIVVERERVGLVTATEAARLALEEGGAPKMRIAEPAPESQPMTRQRIAAPAPRNAEELDVDEDTAALGERLQTMVASRIP